MNFCKYKKAVFATLAFLLSCGARAASTGDTDSVNVTINELTVYGNRQNELLMHLPSTVSIISAQRISTANAQTTSDVLAKTGLLSVQKSQQGGGSPSIRGFEASRILLVVDGVKMNNLIYRAGHLQNLITVDPGSLERIELMYGPASVSYGSDALGGVIVMNTPEPVLSPEGKLNFFGKALARYNSVNDGTTLHADFNIGGKKFGSFTSLSFNRFGDLRSGRNKNPFLPDDDSYIYRKYTVGRLDGRDVLIDNPKYWHQPGSGYLQYDVLQKFLFKQSDQTEHVLNFQFSNTNNVPRYDRLTDMSKGKPKFAQWYYGPQTRLLGVYNLNAKEALGADDFSLRLSYQNIKESRHNRKLNDPWLGSRCENVNVVSLSTDWVKFIGAHKLHAGLDGSLQFLKSTAHATDINNGETKPLDTRYPDGKNTMHDIEAFLSHTWTINPKLTMTDGLRVGYTALRANFLVDDFYPFHTLIGAVKQDNPTYSLSVGLAYNPVPTWKIGMNLSTGYRVPNIDDLAKVFDSEPGKVIMPNPNIRPEQTLNADINIASYNVGLLEWSAAVFGTYMFDALSVTPGKWDGKEEINYDGTQSKVYVMHNSNHAYVVGAQTSLNVRFMKNFSANTNLTYTYGNYLGHKEGDKMPLDHVAPLYGRVGINFESSCRRFKVDLFSLFNGKKSFSRYNMNGEDNAGYATQNGLTGENFKGMPAWFTLNLQAAYRPTKNISVEAGVDNILDTEYRVFASGINAPGRNFFTAIRVSF